MTNEHDDMRDMLAAYSLDAIDELERARIEQFLAEDQDARRELARYESAAAALAGDTSVEPPAEVWAAIQARLAETPRRRTAPRLRRTRTWLAVAAVLLVAAGVGLALSRVGNGPSRTGQLEAALRDPDAGTGTLAGEGVQAQVAIRPDGRGYLDARSLPELPAGKVYQLWSLDATTPLSLGVLRPQDGIATFTAATTSHTLALSVESAPGAEQPTLPPAATVELTPIRPQGGA